MKNILLDVFKFLGRKAWKYKFGLIVFIVAAVVITLGYVYMWGWTGLTGTAQIQTTNKGVVTTTLPVPVTLWNWIQVLIIPGVLAYAAYWLNKRQSSREQEATKKRDETERRTTLDNQQAAVLDRYLDGMSDLMLNKNLRESKSDDDEVRQVARAKTLTALRRLDPKRKGDLLRFLYEAGLIKKGTRIISLSGADLTEAHLFGAHLSGAHLFGADLTEADLTEAHLRRAHLSGADLFGADLTRAIVTEEQLAQALSLHNATMPDGRKHP